MKQNSTKSTAVNPFMFSENTRLAIFVHWSRNDRISDHDQNFIQCLAAEFDQVLVVCNRNGLGNKNRPQLSKPNDKVQIIERENEGYDFGGYQAGMSHIRDASETLTEILLVNNSVFLLKNSLSDLIQEVRDSDFDVTAVTSSTEEKFHLQSYFIHFKKQAFENPGLWDWFSTIETSNDKRATVTSLEIPFSTEMNVLGYTCGAIWESQQVMSFLFSSAGSNLLNEFRRETKWIFSIQTFLNNQSLNPTHYMWPHLLELGCPFIKKDLVREKYIRELGVSRWVKYCKSVEIENLIKRELTS
jgi:lipopolysaccharide biosynthesis protein